MNIESSKPAPQLPAYAGADGLGRLAYEVIDHLWPWSRRGFQRQKALHAAGLALAALVTMVWAMAAAGELAAGSVIAWWLGWSVFEVAIRMHSKPYVKDGIWWGSNYRTANLMDMICYVLFKNLLVGAVLFLGLKSLGFLQV